MPEKGGSADRVGLLGSRESVPELEVSRGTLADVDDRGAVGRTLVVVLVWRIRVRARG